MITNFNLPPLPALPSQPKSLRILVVEDHKETLRSLKLLLTSLGYNVSVAQTVDEALHVAEDERFDLLLTDIGLPDGDGCELLSAIRQRQGINAIALTGHGMDDELRKSHEAGFLHHLVKPTTIDLLKAAIQEAQTHHE